MKDIAKKEQMKPVWRTSSQPKNRTKAKMKKLSTIKGPNKTRYYITKISNTKTNAQPAETQNL